QKLVSQLELLDEKLSQENVNQKLLRSLSPVWNTHAIVWRNKADLDTMSMHDLYNNLKVYEPKVKGMYGYIKNHKKTIRNGQARTRESEEYKKKPRIQSCSQKKSQAPRSNLSNQEAIIGHSSFKDMSEQEKHKVKWDLLLDHSHN
ncbi:hypothetical protein Tco_0028332, partial [Tanacetum coccineum]